MNKKRYYNSFIIINNMSYVSITGRINNITTNNAKIYDIIIDKFTTIDCMNYSRMNHMMTNLDNNMILIT